MGKAPVHSRDPSCSVNDCSVCRDCGNPVPMVDRSWANLFHFIYLFIFPQENKSLLPRNSKAHTDCCPTGNFYPETGC